jgi:hypothetical protein
MSRPLRPDTRNAAEVGFDSLEPLSASDRLKLTILQLTGSGRTLAEWKAQEARTDALLAGAEESDVTRSERLRWNMGSGE